MINLPEWTKNSRFDIDARVAPEDVARYKALSLTQMSSTLQSVLVDRFKIVVRHEAHDLPVYNLVIAKGGLKPAIKPVDANKPGLYLQGGDNHISMHNLPIASLDSALSRLVHRTVIDKTGLNGNYDVELKFTPDSYDPAMAKSDKEAAEAAARAGNDGEAPTLFTAIQEQLGLKLVSAKGPVDCIVIDHIEKPAAN